MSMGDYRVADISLADFGRKEISLAEVEVSRRPLMGGEGGRAHAYVYVRGERSGWECGC